MNQNIIKLPLPPEIIVHISKYLNIQDKLKLRLINKSFKFVFDNLIKLDRLTIIPDNDDFIRKKFDENGPNCVFDYYDDYYDDYFNRIWFYTNRSNDEIDLIEYNFDTDTNILYELFKKDLFINVRKLFFCYSGKINFNETINQFKYLEELNIDCMLESSSTISLSQLRILSIDINHHNESTIKVELNTPLLSILRCENLNHYLFNYSEKITYFDTGFMWRNDSNLIGPIKIFKNLKYIVLMANKLNQFKPILTKFNQLKEIHIFENDIYFSSIDEFNELYEYKCKLKLSDLRMFLSGIDYANLKESNEDLAGLIDQFELILRNYSKTIDIIPFLEHMDFDQLFEFLNRNPDISLDNINHKFPNIKNIVANNVTIENVDCFFEFLSKYDNLIGLKLNLLLDNKINYLNRLPDFLLDNKIIYLNRLPDLFKRIKRLKIVNFNVNKLSDLDFLFKLKNLHKLSLGKIDNPYILKELPNRLCISFTYENDHFRIYKRDNSSYVSNVLPYEVSCLDSLIYNLIERDSSDYSIERFGSFYSIEDFNVQD